MDAGQWDPDGGLGSDLAANHARAKTFSVGGGTIQAGVVGSSATINGAVRATMDGVIAG